MRQGYHLSYFQESQLKISLCVFTRMHWQELKAGRGHTMDLCDTKCSTASAAAPGLSQWIAVSDL